ncbi:MAG: hypothetical protein OXH92_18845 [Bryobacterales bacterium]|nr:hypothetical protein [Bryobacterales bacterium]
MTSLRLLAVLDVPSSTPARAKRLAPRPDGPLTHFASPRGEKCRLTVIDYSMQPAPDKVSRVLRQRIFQVSSRSVGSCFQELQQQPSSQGHRFALLVFRADHEFFPTCSRTSCRRAGIEFITFGILGNRLFDRAD